MKLKNPMLVVTDIDRSVEFYKKVFGLHRYGNRRSCWYEQRHFQQSLYYLGQIQKEMASVLPAPLFPVPSHADGRRTRRRIFEELAK